MNSDVYSLGLIFWATRYRKIVYQMLMFVFFFSFIFFESIIEHFLLLESKIPR